MFYKGGKMLIRIILAILMAFALGMLVSMMVDASPVVEQAQDTVKIFSNPQDVPSPSDTIKQEDIHVYANRIEIVFHDPIVPAGDGLVGEAAFVGG